MISRIQVNNFRSYKHLDIHLSKNINVFIGRNGQGKTNLLEAIYFVSNIRSHRTKNDTDLIKRNEEYSRIIIDKDNGDTITTVIHDKGKYFSINDLTVKKTSEILGTINTVLFYPTETRLFSDSPGVRRNFFDVEIGKVSNEYLSDFQNFASTLRDRNKVLKSDKIDEILLGILTNQLIETQKLILKERENLVNFINKYINYYLLKLIKKDLKIRLEYKSTLKSLSDEEILERYKSNLKRDIFTKLTNEGIHRDDYIIYSDGIEVDKFLSQGQIRMVLLGIKFVLVHYIYLKTNETPILLLDDVLSELDSENQINLLNAIPQNVQTIITTTDDYNIFKSKDIKKYIISNSTIINEED